MANRLKMADVQAILTLHERGWSDRRIARELGVHRETVGRHVRLAENPKPASAPTGPTGVAGAPIGGDETIPVDIQSNGSVAWPWRQVIIQKLQQGLHAQRIYQDLCSPEHGYGGSYYSVRRLIKKLTRAHDPPMRRMECAAGEEAQVDFGKGAWIVEADGKGKTRRRRSWVFRIVLSHSRKGYSEAVLRQTTDEFLRCLENAFAHFGGVTKTLIIDNLRAAVSRADWFDPELCPKVRSFAEHYGIAILPTKPRTPRHKGKIESDIKYVKNNGLKGLSFSSLAEENRHLLQWESTVADTRIHGTTRQQVIKLFNEIEKPALLPLPQSRFELFNEALRNVHRDGHVQVKGAYYSVPPEYLGQEVWARWDGGVVRLFDTRMRPIALHAQQSPGKFSTLNTHIVPEKISGIERGTTWLLQQVDRIGVQSKAWAEAMLQARGIEGVRVLMGLLSLSNKHSRIEIERACQVAVGYGAYHLRSLRQLIEQQKTKKKVEMQQNFEFVQTFAQAHPIIRPLADYGQWVRRALAGQLHSSVQPFTTEECAT
jgi:transposase